MAYHLKYEGQEVDKRLDLAGTALQAHQDISHLATKNEVNSQLVAKVDKEDGKGLSSEDYTTEEKQKLAALDTTIKQAVEKLQVEVAKKQDSIEDLEEIREGASKGATALQEHQDISNLVTKEEVSKGLDYKVDKVSGKQLSTEDFTTLLKQKLEGLFNYDDTEISQAVSELRADLDTLVSGDATTAIKTFNEVIDFLDGVQDSQDLSSIIASIEQQIAGKMDKVTLATVATTGNYNDLSNKPTIPSEQVNADWNATSGKARILNKPTIPSAVTESTVSDWGFTKNTGTYSKPNGGIPKTDLASAVQTSLGKADTALQFETYKGTIGSVDADISIDDVNPSESKYTKLLDNTFAEDVDTFSVLNAVPTITAYKDFIILFNFKYDDNDKNRQGYIHFNSYIANAFNSIRLEKIVNASYLTHYILRIHVGEGYENTAYLESHTNSFLNYQYTDGHQGLNLFCVIENTSYQKFNNFLFDFAFKVGERIRIYGK